MNKLVKYTIPALLITLFLTSCGGSGTKKTTYTLYEDGEDGLVERWEVRDGLAIENVQSGANGSKRSIYLKQNWDLSDPEHPINNANYILAMENDHEFIVEFDKMKIARDELYCFTTGATVETDQGVRHISYDTFYDREGYDAITQEFSDGSIEMVFPLSMSYVNDSNVWKHVRLDLAKELHRFEPENNIIKVIQFYFQGGDDYLDNIQLVSK